MAGSPSDDPALLPALDRGIVAGIEAFPAFAYGVVPELAPRFAAHSLYRWEVTMRETVIVGLVGASGLGRSLAEQTAAFDHAAMLTTILALVVLALLVDLTSATMRSSLR